MVIADCIFCTFTDVINVLENALPLMETTDDGIIILPCNEEPAKQSLSVIVTVGGIIMFDNTIQFANVTCPKFIKVFPTLVKSTLCNDIQLKNV